MSDERVTAALRTDAGLVVVETPAGCGKTFHAASYAAECAPALRPGRMLVLTHTHAASDLIAKRTVQTKDIDIRTIDSLLVEVAAAYHRAIGLPPDVSAWARQNKDGYTTVAARVETLLWRGPHIAQALARRYRIVLCDEHQDSNPHQHAIVMILGKAGSRLRIFGDPMQTIFDKKGFDAAAAQWASLRMTANIVESLETGHRWKDKAPELGAWILQARAALRDGKSIDLRGSLPRGLTIVRADNQIPGYGWYGLHPKERKPIDGFIDAKGPVLVLSAQNSTVDSLRGVFARRLPIWEGHTRNALDILVRQAATNAGKPVEMAQAVSSFLGEIAVGFSPSEFGKSFVAEVESNCAKQRTGLPGLIQDLARILLKFPDHRGIASVLERTAHLIDSDERFKGKIIDRPREFREAIQLAEFDDVSLGHSELTRRRTFLRPTHSPKTLSTIHKAKGLECERVAVLPCDGRNFGDKPHHRCLLYVALSRAVSELMLVVPHNDPSPLVLI